MRVELFQYNHLGNIRKFFKNSDFEFFFCDNDILGKKMNGSSKAECLGYVFIDIDSDKNIKFFNTEIELENYKNKDFYELKKEIGSYEKYLSEKFLLISKLETQLKELRDCGTLEEVENYKIKYNHFEKIKNTKEKNRIEKIQKCKEQIILYLKNNKDTFKLKNMLYDLKINNKTFYNYKLDEFLKNLKKN